MMVKMKVKMRVKQKTKRNKMFSNNRLIPSSYDLNKSHLVTIGIHEWCKSQKFGGK